MTDLNRIARKLDHLKSADSRFTTIVRPGVHYSICHRPRPSRNTETWITDGKYEGIQTNGTLVFTVPNGTTREVHPDRIVHLQRTPNSAALLDEREALLDAARVRRAENHQDSPDDDHESSTLARVRARIAERVRAGAVVFQSDELPKGQRP